MSGDIAHPLVVRVPRVAAPVATVARVAALTLLRRTWTSGRLDIELPDGRVEQIGTAARPDAHARVIDERFFVRLLLRGELGAGEGYVAGEWDADDVVAVCQTFLRGTRAQGAESLLTRLASLPSLLRHRRAANTPAGSARNIHAHYDLGNAFYGTFLDPETLSYSCALADAAAPFDLVAAQHAKHERLCAWLELSPRDHLLEIGCGWGGMAIHAARTRGCRVTAITVSREQHALARQRVAAAGLTALVDVQYRDYRELTGSFDKLVSIEMLEAVGEEYLPAFFTRAAQLVRPGGLFALQSITMPHDRIAAYRRRVDWMQTYIFPGSFIPSLPVIDAAARDFTRLRTDDIGPAYAPTLAAWRTRFHAAAPQVRALGFDAPFLRTWHLYLAFSEAAFAERTLGDHQLLLRRT